MFAGVGLILVFFGAWFGLATLSYGKAEERREAEKKSDEDEEDEEE
jgi:hypothetical protein